MLLSLMDIPLISQALKGFYPALFLALCLMVLGWIWKNSTRISVKEQLIYGGIALISGIITIIIYSQNLIAIISVAILIFAIAKVITA